MSKNKAGAENEGDNAPMKPEDASGDADQQTALAEVTESVSEPITGARISFMPEPAPESEMFTPPVKATLTAKPSFAAKTVAAAKTSGGDDLAVSPERAPAAKITPVPAGETAARPLEVSSAEKLLAKDMPAARASDATPKQRREIATAPKTSTPRPLSGGKPQRLNPESSTSPVSPVSIGQQLASAQELAAELRREAAELRKEFSLGSPSDAKLDKLDKADRSNKASAKPKLSLVAKSSETSGKAVIRAVAKSEAKIDRVDASPANLSNLTYVPELADRAVRAKNLLTDKRFLKMAKTLMRFSLEFAADKVLTSKRKDDLEQRQKGARRLRQALEDLGPTFIKLGQFMSVRRDCLSVEMADELALLQDKVPPFPFELVRKTITGELGAPPEQVFASIEEKAIASASIGQVHKAVLKDGRPVVIKVQRPDLARRFYQDLGCMRLLARWGVLLRPEGQWQSWIELSDEFGKTLFQELNYIQEGKNSDRVRTILKEQPEVQVPRVYWKFTGRRVLTLEYLPGIKIDRVKELEQKGYNLAKIANQLVSSYLEMVLMHGFFHADPHAGNLSIAPDGRIIIYDFGMMGEITEANKESITGCIAAVIKKDVDELIKNLVLLGIVEEEAPREPIKRTIQPFIDYYAGKPLLSLDFTDLEHDIDNIVDDRSLCLPPTLAYLLRAGTSLEGIARTLIPNFSFVEAAKPPLRRFVVSRPHYAASLVKVFINGNLSIGQDAFLKLTPGKQPDSLGKATKDDKNKKNSINTAGQTNVAPAAPAASFEELTEVRARILMLEKEVKEQSKQGYLLAGVAVWLVFSTVASFVRECSPYLHYFLIGNGVMGAIIMWHLVTHLRPDNNPKKIRRKKAVQEGNGDKRC